ncbi:polyhydroxyalkanoic acid system family protein [Patescibacteria group bacterium]|nr:polyhydroxyalkanoic acid system family protein [Patescibacteria group bacterium]MBU4458748.1 polyhydroxyalkanoic acid system family protein [Patescibacteria group bacterium]MCG2696049.1 polyhydroxyalkanoic acid system family protein [Candidatus Portnoybacteria bacterium]
MPKIELQHRTSLLASQIKERAENLIQGAEKDFKGIITEVQQHWEGNTLFFSFKAMGFSVSGEATAEDYLVVVKAKLPFAAVIFKGKIEAIFKEKAQELFP